MVRALLSHGRGHWFESSIAHFKGKASIGQKTTDRAKPKGNLGFFRWIIRSDVYRTTRPAIRIVVGFSLLALAAAACELPGVAVLWSRKTALTAGLLCLHLGLGFLRIEPVASSRPSTEIAPTSPLYASRIGHLLFAQTHRCLSHITFLLRPAGLTQYLST